MNVFYYEVLLLEGYIVAEIFVLIPGCYTSREDKEIPLIHRPRNPISVFIKPTLYRYSQPEFLRPRHLLLFLKDIF